MSSMAMTLRLDDQALEALRITAKAEGRSMQAVACAAISQYTSQWEARRSEALRRIVTEDVELLRRLGDA